MQSFPTTQYFFFQQANTCNKTRGETSYLEMSRPVHVTGDDTKGTVYRL